MIKLQIFEEEVEGRTLIGEAWVIPGDPHGLSVACDDSVADIVFDPKLVVKWRGRLVKPQDGSRYLMGLRDMLTNGHMSAKMVSE